MAGLSGCQKKEGPAEHASKEIDKTAEKTDQQIDESMEKAGEKMKDAGHDQMKRNRGPLRAGLSFVFCRLFRHPDGHQVFHAPHTFYPPDEFGGQIPFGQATGHAGQRDHAEVCFNLGVNGTG